MRPWIAAILLAASCVTVGGGGSSDSFGRHDVVEAFVRWREGERRRDVEMAQSVLFFESRGDRIYHRDELAALGSVFAGPIRTSREIHMVGHPEPLGPGDYLFLEPAGRGYAATFVAIVAVNREPRIVYRRPILREGRRRDVEPGEFARMQARERIADWESLAGEELAVEVQRTKRMLHYQIQAEAYADRNGLPLARFAPRPREILERLDPLGPEAARGEIVRMLRDTLVSE